MLVPFDLLVDVSIPIRSPRGERLYNPIHQTPDVTFQSAPREGATKKDRSLFYRTFQSTLPAGVSDIIAATRSRIPIRFQSTLSPRGAPPPRTAPTLRARFNPRSPRGRAQQTGMCPFDTEFQSTLPAGGSDVGDLDMFLRAQIVSIHAPREGSNIAPDFLR